MIVGILVYSNLTKEKEDTTDRESINGDISESSTIIDAATLHGTEVTMIAAIDQTEIMEHPDFIKEVYVPIIPDGSNLALDGEVEASSFNQSFTPRKAIDGNADGASYWEAEGDSYPNEIVLDLLELSSIHAIKVRLNPAYIWGKRTQTFEVQVSVDGESYDILEEETIYTFDPDYGNEVLLEFEAISVQYIKLIFTDNTGANGAQVAELEVYGEIE